MAQTIAKSRIKKKVWYPLIAPSMFRNAVLGETLVYDETAMMGKTITQNLMNLTGDVKKQNIKIGFIVTQVKDGKAFTKVTGYYMIPSSIRRLTRRRSEKIELSFTADTSDGKHIRIKPLIFAISNIKGSVGSHLRRTTTDFLLKTIKNMTYEDLISNLINQNLQRTLRDNIKKIYPVRVCQIRSFYIEKEEKKEVAAKETPKEVKEKEVEVKEEAKKEVKEEIKSEEKPKEEKIEVKQEPKVESKI